MTYNLINSALEENHPKISLSTIKFPYKKLRIIISNYVKQKMTNLLLDGAVEIDETLIYRKKIQGNSQSRPRKIQIWLIGIVSRINKEFIVYQITQRNEQTMIPLILKHVAFNSEIYTDSYSVYVNNRCRPKRSRLEPLGYVHGFVNHKIEFVSSIYDQINTNKIERTWRSLKSLINIQKPKIFVEEVVLKYYLNRLFTPKEQFYLIISLIKQD